MLLKELTSLNGAAGDEDAVREYIREKIVDIADDITIDNMGNLIAFKSGISHEKKIMLSAHMDEVALIVTAVKDDGTIKFSDVGGIDSRILLGQKVVIGKNKINGVIGSKPIHMQDKTERTTPIKEKNLYIDIGTTQKEETLKVINLGDYIYFISEYTEFGDSRIKAKALDDRVGCAILIEVLKKKYPFDVYACFTVQEEVGLRGSIVTSNKICPDVALVVEGTTCSDVHNVKPSEYSTELGKGVALTVMDRTAIVDKELLRYLEEVAKQIKIKFQYKKTISGGNDAGSIQRSGRGIKVASISVPCRYIHSPVSVMSKNDYEDTLKLAVAFLENMK
ncbi:MAG: M42 family metallopeptidase [Clostridiales bacterium]|nr:M42 family metallopeptidase [Clostridiales bacterium]